MAKMNTSHRYIYDAAPATNFRSRSAAALTATADTTEVVFDKMEGQWNKANEIADDTLAVVINVTAIDKATGDETYTFALKATDGAGAVKASVGLGSLVISKVGQYVLLVDTATAKLIDNTVGGLKLTATLAGTTPSITFHSWMSQIVDAA